MPLQPAQQHLKHLTRCQTVHRLRVTRHTSSRGHGHCCKALPADVAAGLALAFLPWSGCSQGGFYATGVEGAHGQNCQAIYQPAYAAEQRLAARLQQQLEEKQLRTTQQAAATAVIQQPPQSANDSNIDGSSSSDGSPKQQLPDAAMSDQQSQPQLTSAEHMQLVPDAAKELVRDILHEDNKQRTKQLVDDAWQTLE